MTEKNAVALQDKLNSLKKYSRKRLVEYGKKHFGLDLDATLCRGDLYKKVAYKVQASLGLSTERSDKNEAKLSTPAHTASSKKEGKKELAKEEERATTATANLAKASTSTKDPFGFREGTKGSKMFQALAKGCTASELEKLGGAAVPGFIAGIKKDPVDWSAGRLVTITKTEPDANGDVHMKITEYTGKGGITDGIAMKWNGMSFIVKDQKK